MQIIVNDLLVHYKQQGNGKTVLLVHGWADRLETFDLLMTGLSKHYKVLALDLPGFGQTQAPNEIWNLDNYAKFLNAFLQKVDRQNELWAVVGHSNGGAVVIRGISLQLLTPRKLVLLASSGVRDTANAKRLAIKLVAKTGKAATFWLPQNTKRKLQKKLYGTVGSDMLVTPALQETFKKTVRQDIQKDAARIEVPTLLMYGDQDKATPLDSVGKKLHTLIKNSVLETIPSADHFIHHVQAVHINTLILEFLK